MQVTIKLTDENLKDLEPLLHRTNRDLKNFVHSLVLASIAVSKKGSSMFDIDCIGKVNLKKTKVITQYEDLERKVLE